MRKSLIITIAALFVISLIGVSSYLIAKDTQTKTGWITDTMCKEKGANAAHKECALKCVKSGMAKFAFYDNDSKVTFEIDNQGKAKEFAGEEVVVKGVFDADKKMVNIDSISKVEKK